MRESIYVVCLLDIHTDYWQRVESAFSSLEKAQSFIIRMNEIYDNALRYQIVHCFLDVPLGRYMFPPGELEDDV